MTRKTAKKKTTRKKVPTKAPHKEPPEDPPGPPDDELEEEQGTTPPEPPQGAPWPPTVANPYRVLQDWEIPDFTGDVNCFVAGASQSGKSYYLEKILAHLEGRMMPSIFLDMQQEFISKEPALGRRICRTWEELHDALNVDLQGDGSVKGPNAGTVVFTPNEHVIAKIKDYDDFYEQFHKYADWWAGKLKKEYPDGSRKLSIFLPEIGNFCKVNSAPMALRGLSKYGRHKFHIFMACQQPVGIPSEIVGNANYCVGFHMHIQGHIDRMVEFSPYFQAIPDLKTHECIVVDRIKAKDRKVWRGVLPK